MESTIRNIILGTIFYSLLGGCGQSAGTVELRTDTEEDVKMILGRQDRFLAEHSYKDGTKLAEFYTNDAVLIPPDEPIVRGKRAIAEWYQRQFEKATLIENPKVTIEEIQVHDNLAFNRGNYILKFEGETTNKPVVQNLRFMAIWKKQPDGFWKFYRDIWNTNASSAQE